MNKIYAAWFLIGFLLASPSAWSDIQCEDDENLVIGYFGVNPTVTDLPAIPPYSGASSAELAAVQLEWQSSEDEYRFQESTSTDYQAKTQSNVNLTDWELGSTTKGLRDAELLETSNFELGQLDIAFCMPSNRDAGLIFGIYKNEDVVVGLQISPFFIESFRKAPDYKPASGFRTTAVLNQAITDQTGRQFNEDTAESIQMDIASVTGVFPPRYLVQSIFQREISATFRENLRDAALFHNTNSQTTVIANMVMTKSWLSVTAPHSVTRVEQNGINILDENNQIELINQVYPPLDELEFGEIEVFVYGEGEKRPVLLVSNSTVMFIPSYGCDQPKTMEVNTWPSVLHGITEFWNDHKLVEQWHNDDQIKVNIEADHCDHVLTFRRYICFGGKIIASKQSSVSGVKLTLPEREFCAFPGYNDMPPTP